MQVRPAKPSDVKRLQQIDKKTYGKDFWKGCIWSTVRHQSSIKIQVADDNGEIVGFVVFECRNSGCEILRLAVDPLHHRKRIGTMLLMIVIMEAATPVEIAIMDSNSAGNEFLRSNGFKAVQVIRNFAGGSRSAFLMRQSARIRVVSDDVRWLQ